MSRLELREGWLIICFCGDMKGNDRDGECLKHMAVTWVAWYDKGNIVGWVKEGGEEGCEGARGTCGNEDMVRRHREAVVGVVMGRKRLTKGEQTGSRGVTLGAGREGETGFGGGDSLRWWRLGGLADF